MLQRWIWVGALGSVPCGVVASADAQSSPVVAKAEVAPAESPPASLEQCHRQAAKVDILGHS